jgi:hypothetical protein
MANSIMSLLVYKHNTKWVFDDAAHDLVREPFVSGADKIIDQLVKHIPNPDFGFVLLFSTTEFPEAHRLDWQNAGSGGNWYYSKEFDLAGWLCPALFCYFSEAPKQIFAKAESLA